MGHSSISEQKDTDASVYRLSRAEILSGLSVPCLISLCVAAWNYTRDQQLAWQTAVTELRREYKEDIREIRRELYDLRKSTP